MKVTKLDTLSKGEKNESRQTRRVVEGCITIDIEVLLERKTKHLPYFVNKRISIRSL
jgi:hypothetical protein